MTKPSGASDGLPGALMLAPEAPYPLEGGGALRSAALLHYLSESYTVDLIVFRQPGAPHPSESLPPGLVRDVHVINLPFHSRKPIARAWRNLERGARKVPPLIDRFSGFERQIRDFLRGRHYAVAVIEHMWCAGYHGILAPHAGRLVLDLHNVESVLHARSADAASWPAAFLHRRFSSACLELERTWLPQYWRILTASRHDADLVNRIAPGARPVVYPNTIPPVAAPERREGHFIAFSGNLEYAPNVDAVRHFRQAIWPNLSRRWPALEWRVIGKNPHAVQSLVSGEPRIRLAGAVANPVAMLAEALVAIVPLLAGSGTRVKILEAWAAGAPVVSTAVGAEGLEGTPGEHWLQADDPAEFTEAVELLLSSPDRRKAMGRAGRALYEQQYTWDVGWEFLRRTGI